MKVFTFNCWIEFVTKGDLSKAMGNILQIIRIIIIIITFVLLSGCSSVDSSSTNDADDITGKSQIKSDELKWKWIVEPGKYEDLFFVTDDFIAVKGNNGKYTVINTKGNSVIPYEYDNISKFSEGVALVNINGKYSYIDRKGLSILEDRYQDGYSFSESMGAVKRNNKWGYINLSGELIIKSQFEEVKPFVENHAAVKIVNKWGYIDKSGQMIIKPQYDQVENFSEDIAAVKLNGKWGFVNSDGNIIVDLEYDEVKDFHEGYAAVMKNNKWGFINNNGKMCIDLKYDDVGNFSEGKASVKLSNYIENMDAWAYIDHNENIVIDFYPYDASEGRMIWVGEFKDGIAFTSKTLYCIIDSKGNNVFCGDSEFFISELSYDRRFNAIPGYVFTDDSMKIRKYGLLGLNGDRRLEPVFDYVGEINGSYVIVENVIDGVYKKGVIEIFN